MEAISLINPTKTNPTLPFSNFSAPLLRTRIQTRPSLGLGLKLAAAGTGCFCGRGGSIAEIERKLEAEMKPELEGEEWFKKGKLREKCAGGKGVVELLECLEREAIMGEDEGRDPTDYNRRAKIFDKSSRVFQALKQLTDHSSHHP